MHGPSDRQLLDLIGDIYDCVLIPDRWEAVADAIRRRFNLHNAILASNSFDSSGGQYQVILGIPEPYLSILLDTQYEAHFMNLWGGVERLMAVPLGEPVLQSTLCSPEHWSENPYSVAFAIPQGLIDAVGIGLVRDQRHMATFAAGRHHSQGAFTDAEMDGMRLLAPHLRRAITMSRLFDDTLAKAATFTSALEASPTGIILVDAELGVVHANGLAHDMLAQGDPVLSRNQRLRIREEVAPGALAQAVARCGSGVVQSQSSGSAIPARRTDGSPVLIHVLPLQGGELRPGIMERAVAALFVAPAPGPIQLPGDALAALFDLTPAELRVMDLVVQGLSIADAGHELGVARSTAKTHLQRVFLKTGVNSREDLARLALQTSTR